MAFLPLRDVALPRATLAAYDDWLRTIEARLADPATDRNELCREILTDLYYPGLAGADPGTLRPAARVALLQLDPRNVTLEPEYYAETDVEAFARVKPLLWLWEMFDKSPLGENVHVGVRFRRILARHVFRRCGENFKCFQFVKFSFGYNMEVGDNVVVHRHVLLDDRAPIVIGNGVSIADYANVYTHTHALGDQRDVECKPVHLEDGVRITYHAVILAGVRMHANSMIGTMGVATRDIESDKVALGIPAVPKLDKPPREQRPAHPVTRDPLADRT
ncbi:MAG TPA: acyltransferase [Longimicrobiales bacterium]|nr:acyltransferase [Longimicrobiales bacterium]